MALNATEKIWFNGKLVPWGEAKVHVVSHALHYGSSVFEGVRCYKTPKGSAIFRGLDHMKRLLASAKVYRMPLNYSAEALLKAAKETVAANKLDECYVRPIAFYGYGSMGVNPAGASFDVAIACWPWGAYLGDEGLRKGIRVTISSWRRIDSQILPGAAKAGGNYLNSLLAKMDAVAHGFDEAVLLNLQGKVAEGSGENIFVVKDGRLCTPPLSAGVLDGITRNSVIVLAQELGIPFAERELSREDLFLADEVFFTGTAAEVTPVREVDGRVVGGGSRGPVTEKLQTAFFDVVKGKNAKFSKWLDYVKRA